MRAWKLFGILVCSAIALFSLVFLFNGINEVSARMNIRLSARISGILFAMAFAASSMQFFIKGPFTFWLLANRKFLGISFAVIHLIHLGFLVLLHIQFFQVFEVAATKSLVGGSLAYLFIVLMLMTSFDYFKALLTSRQWRFLHTAGAYWIWFLFIRSYWNRIDTEIQYLPLFVLFCTVMILRIGKEIKRQVFTKTG